MDSINGSEKLNVDSPTVLSSTKGSLSMPTKNINYFHQLRRNAHTTAIAPIPIISSSPASTRPQPFVASTWSNTTGGICKQCEGKIVDQSLTLSTGATYHPGCLLCQQCSKAVTDNAFTLLDSKVYHHQVGAQPDCGTK
jgi:LIM domain